MLDSVFRVGSYLNKYYLLVKKFISLIGDVPYLLVMYFYCLQENLKFSPIWPHERLAVNWS